MSAAARTSSRAFDVTRRIFHGAALLRGSPQHTETGGNNDVAAFLSGFEPTCASLIPLPPRLSAPPQQMKAMESSLCPQICFHVPDQAHRTSEITAIFRHPDLQDTTASIPLNLPYLRVGGLGAKDLVGGLTDKDLVRGSNFCEIDNISRSHFPSGIRHQLTSEVEQWRNPMSEQEMECGRGDKRTKKGKRFKGSYGNARPTKKRENQRLREKWEGVIPSGDHPLVPLSITLPKPKTLED